MRTLIAAIAAFGIGTAASSTTAEAVAWPIVMDFNYCWGAATCPYGAPPVYFQIERNGSFTVSDGFTGDWRYIAAQRRIGLRYSGGSPIYFGIVQQGCVTDGYMDVGGAQQGTWSGCVR